MDSEENIPAESLLDLQTTESQDYIPTEVWSKIVSFLPLHDRCSVEGVNHQLSAVAKSSWDKLQLNKLWISSISFDSAAKFATLLRRCGSQLEEMLTERHIRVDSDDQTFHLCPNLKVLSFANHSSLLLAKRKDKSEMLTYLRVRQLLTSLPKLERLQFLSTIAKGNGGNSVVTIKDFVLGLLHVQSLQELHIPLTWLDGPTVNDFGALQQLRVLSLVVPTDLYWWTQANGPPRNSLLFGELGDPVSQAFGALILAIGRLSHLEELQLHLSGELTQHVTTDYVLSLALSVPNLRSLVLVLGRGKSQIQSDSIETLISQFVQLRTLVIVCQIWTVLDLRVELSQFSYNRASLNIFVVDYCQSRFTGHSPRINVIPMPNGHTGDGIDFISSYSQNGFDFGTEKCLQMVKMSNEVGGIWDFAYESEEKEDSDDDDT